MIKFKNNQKMDKQLLEWKNRGNTFFKQQEYLKAINCWEEAIVVAKEQYQAMQEKAQVSKDDSSQTTIDQASALQEKMREIIQLQANLNGNLALGHLKRNEIDESEFYNSTCLQFDPGNVKAHYRNVQYFVARGQLLEAKELAEGCVKRFEKEGEAAVKPFKDLLATQIIQKLREAQGEEETKKELLDLEVELKQLIEGQKHIAKEKLDRYIGLVNFYRH